MLANFTVRFIENITGDSRTYQIPKDNPALKQSL